MRLLVRAATYEDLGALQEIERAAGQRYRDFGLDHVADDEPASIQVLSGYVEAGRAWAAMAEDEEPVGYIVVDEVDGAGHIEQVSVLPGHQGRGVGRALIDRAAEWAVSRGMTALTLTTFGHLPWNRPLYEHLGFRVLGEDGLGPGLRSVRDSEAVHGLDPALRVAMRRELGTISAGPAGRGIQVRPARREDVAPAAEVYLRSRRGAVPAIPPLIHGDDDVRRWFAETVFTEHELWIAEDAGGRVVGVMVLAGTVIEQLYVDPEYARAGVGSQLLRVARSLRPGGLQLWTFQANQDARGFYEQHRFTAAEWTDGANNEEHAPDVRYVWEPGAAPSQVRRSPYHRSAASAVRDGEASGQGAG